MKVKIKIPVSTAEQIQKFFTFFCDRIEPTENYILYCHQQNIKNARYYIQKRIFLSEGADVALCFTHDTITTLMYYATTAEGTQAVHRMEVALQMVFNDLFEQARAKMCLEGNILMARKPAPAKFAD
jgi:hypothetical protein